MARYDILIKGGMVLDGKRGAIRRADVGLDGNKIKFVGEAGSSSGLMEIDASGKYVAPGFIDLTSHSDTHWRLFLDPSQESLLRQGVTTILGGNCGASLAPLVSGGDIQGIERWVDISQININWQGMNEFLKELGAQKLGVNFGTLVGHGTLRKGVLGLESRVPNQAEIDQMRLLLSRSLKAGAFGMSTSLGAAYGEMASDDEIAALLQIVAENGALAKHHLKDEGVNILPSLSQLIGFTRQAGVSCHVSHLKAVGRRAWEHAEEVVALLDGAKNEGLAVSADVFPYISTGSNLFMLLPTWALAGGQKEILDLIRTPEKRKLLAASLIDMTLHYERIIIASIGGGEADVVGKSVSQLADNAGKRPEDVMLDLLDINDLRVGIFNEVINPDNMAKFLAWENSAVASDGVGYRRGDGFERDLPHPRSFGAFSRVLEEFVKEKKLLSWEEAVYKMSGLPASILGLKNRGVLEKGYMADVIVFDPERVRDAATYSNPFLFAEGVEWVFVNGRPVIENAVLNGDNLNGQVIKKG